MTRSRYKVEETGDIKEGIVVFHGWLIDQTEEKYNFAVCRVRDGDNVLYNTVIEVLKENIIEAKKL